MAKQVAMSWESTLLGTPTVPVKVSLRTGSPERAVEPVLPVPAVVDPPVVVKPRPGPLPVRLDPKQAEFLAELEGEWQRQGLPGHVPEAEVVRFALNELAAAFAPEILVPVVRGIAVSRRRKGTTP